MARLESMILDECGPWRQALLLQPPRLVHATAWAASLALAVAVTWAAWTPANLVVRTSGRVRPQEIPTQVFTVANPRLNGRVVHVGTHTGDRVAAGQVLLRLDTGELDAAAEKTQRQLTAAAQELAQLQQWLDLLGAERSAAQRKAQAELEQVQEELQQALERQGIEIVRAQAALDAARDQLERHERLLAKQAVAEAELVDSRLRYREAQEKLRSAELPVEQRRLEVAKEACELVPRGFAVRQAELETRCAARRGEREVARRELAHLEQLREMAVVRAPRSGIVTRGDVKPGDVVELGKPVFELAGNDGLCFEAAVASEDIGLLREGMSARVKFDAFDYQKYGTLEGRVRFIAPDSQPAAATGGPATSYVVRVDLAGDRLERGEWRGDIRLGMSGRVEIVTGRQSLLGFLLRRVRSAISLG